MHLHVKLLLLDTLIVHASFTGGWSCPRTVPEWLHLPSMEATFSGFPRLMAWPEIHPANLQSRGYL